MDDGSDENTPLVTGIVHVQEIVACLYNQPEIDHGLRMGIMWTPSGNNLGAFIMTFNGSGE